MKRMVPLLAIVTIIGAVIFFATHTPVPPASIEQAPVAAAVYTCDSNRYISAAFYEGPEAPEPLPGQPPTPTGWLEVSFDGSASTTLAQTLSADGARFANEDESLIFWNKGNEALIMHGNNMDLEYTNCFTTR